MKKLLLCCFILFCFKSSLFAQELSFEYDAAGNQTTRRWICVNCPVIRSVAQPTEIAATTPAKEAVTKKTDTTNALPKRKLIAYPNPLTEILNVKWSADDKSYVKSIDVFSMTGVRTYHQNCGQGQSETSISFFNLAPGGYVMRVVYSDDKQEAVRLIKQ